MQDSWHILPAAAGAGFWWDTSGVLWGLQYMANGRAKWCRIGPCCLVRAPGPPSVFWQSPIPSSSQTCWTTAGACAQQRDPILFMELARQARSRGWDWDGELCSPLRVSDSHLPGHVRGRSALLPPQGQAGRYVLAPPTSWSGSVQVSTCLSKMKIKHPFNLLLL